MTPTKGALAPGSAGISTVDLVAVQRHFLNIALLPLESTYAHDRATTVATMLPQEALAAR